MRTRSAAINTILALENIVYFYFIEIGPYTDTDNNENQYQRYVTHNYNLTIDSKLYIADNKIVSVDPPRLSSSVDKESYKIVLTDPDFQFRGLFERGFSQVKVKISIGFYNTSSGTLGGAAVGEPLTNIADTITVYQGTVDNQVYAINPNGGIIVTLECTSPMGALAMSKPFLTTDDSMHQVSSTDTSFSQVFKGSKGIGLLWGKRP